MKLSVITVVRSDPEGLLATGRSIGANLGAKNIEWVVWINASSLELSEHIRIAKEFGATKCVVGDDHGIFDAMNKSLCVACGDYILFLNARDTIKESFEVDEINGPRLIRVTYVNYFGEQKFVQERKTLKLGIPYCHQGIVLPRIGYYYNTGLKYGADYLALLNFNLDWPLPMLSSGLIEYDTSGVSTVNRWESDKWTAGVIRDRFGYSWASIYLAKCLLKLGIKRIFDLKCRLFDK